MDSFIGVESVRSATTNTGTSTTTLPALVILLLLYHHYYCCWNYYYSCYIQKKHFLPNPVRGLFFPPGQSINIYFPVELGECGMLERHSLDSVGHTGRQAVRAVGGAGGWHGWWSVGLADISVSSSLPAVHGIKWTCSNGNSSSGFSVEQLVQQILDSHQTKPPPRTHNCLCTGTLGKG